MQIIELVLSNSGGEIGRYVVQRDEMDDVNLPREMLNNDDLRMAMEMLRPGDTIAVIERWSERD